MQIQNEIDFRVEAEYCRVLMNPICASNQFLQTDSQIHEITPKMDVDYQEAHEQKWRDDYYFFVYMIETGHGDG